MKSPQQPLFDLTPRYPGMADVLRTPPAQSSGAFAPPPVPDAATPTDAKGAGGVPGGSGGGTRQNGGNGKCGQISVSAPFQVQRYCHHLDHTDRPWEKDPHDGWGPVEFSCWCEDQAWLASERHRRRWKALNVIVKANEMRVVEYTQ